MGITESRSPWSLEPSGPSPDTRPGRSPQSSGGNRADCYVGKQSAVRRDIPIEPPHDGNRIVEPVRKR